MKALLQTVLGWFKRVFIAPAGTRQVMFKNTAWLASGRIGSQLMRAFITIYAARALGTAEYGVFSYALALGGFFLFFKNIGIDAILTREVAKYPDKQKQYLATSLGIEVVLLAVTTLLLIFVAPLFSASMSVAMLLPLVAVIIVGDDLRDMAIAFFRGRERMEMETLIVFISNAAIFVFVFFTLSFSGTARGLAAGYALAAVFGALFAFLILRIFIKKFLHSFTKKLVLPILKSAWAIGVGGFASAFLFNVDIIMLGWWRAIEEIGAYSAAQKIVGILGVMTNVLAVSTLPVFSRFSGDENKEKTGLLIEQSMRALFFFSIPFVVGGIILATPVTEFLFGAAYTGGASAFSVLIVSILATYPLSIFLNVLFAHDKQVKVISRAALASIVNFALNILLIPSFGAVGAAIGTIIANTIFAGLLALYVKKITRFRVFAEMHKIIYATIGMGACAFVLNALGLQVLLTISIAGAVYMGVAIILQEKTVHTIMSLLRETR